jgi:hypothetical protein
MIPLLRHKHSTPTVFLISSLSIFESALGFIAIYYHFKGDVKALLWGLVCQSFVLGKTLLFFGMDFATFQYTGHNSWSDYILMFVLPSLSWLIIPILVLWQLFGQVIDLTDSNKKKTK